MSSLRARSRHRRKVLTTQRRIRAMRIARLHFRAAQLYTAVHTLAGEALVRVARGESAVHTAVRDVLTGCASESALQALKSVADGFLMLGRFGQRAA